MDYISWKRDMDEDIETLDLLISMVKDITPVHDCKLNELIRIIRKRKRILSIPEIKKS